MLNFNDYVKQNMGVEVPESVISGAWFKENHIPMVVQCCCCGMTMASPSAWMDDEGYTYCSDCADIKEE